MKTLSTTSGRLVLSTKVNITHRVSLLLFLVLSFVGISGYSQNIYQYTDNSSGVPFFVNSNATGTNLTRGSGLTAATTCTGLTEGFGSVGWSTNTATAINTADANGQFVSLTITPKAGYRLNITGFTASLRAPSGGPTSVRYSYTIGTNPFVQNGDSFTPGTSATCSNSGAARVWASFPNIITTESVTFKIYGFNAGTGDLYLRSINVSGTIECNPAITASITPTSPAICVNDAVTLTGATSGGSVPALTHSWNLINGASFATLSNPTTNIANLVSGVSGGTATAQYTASYGSSPSCSVSATRDVVVNPLPSLILGANPAVCSGATSASLAYTNVIGTPNVYSINFDAAAEAQGFVDAINVSSTFATPISIAIPAGAAPGTYNATFVVENNTIGCESQVYNISVTVNPLPTLNITGASEVCENSSILLTGNSNHPSVTNAWSSSNTSFASTTTGNATSTIGGIAVGNAIITYTSTDDKGCINTATTSITITPQPTNTFTITESSGAFSNDATVCSGDEATIAASTGHTNYKFLDGATVLQNGASNTYTANYTSTKTISVEITGTNGCVKTFSTGITVGSCGVQNTTTGKNFFSISAALSSPTTLNGHTINVGPGTYEEAIIINKQITLLGNNGSGTKPLIFNTSASQVISVSAPNVKIDNFEITVAQTSSNLYGIRTTSSGSFDNLVIEDCHIKGVGTTGAPVFSSMGLLIGTFGGALNDKVTLTNNIIEHTGTSPLGRAVRLYNYNGSISGNTLKAWYSIQAGDSGNGDVLITNNELTGNAEINNITGVGTITGNNFYPSNAYGAGTDNCQLELKNISNPSAAVLVQNNTFNNYVNYGVFAGRVNNVTINNNVFTPSASATNFRSLTVNTKQRTTAVQTAFVNGITVTGNDFKGNGAAGQTGIGFEVANFDNVSSFGTIVLGNQNKFRENIAKPIWLSAETGTAPNTGFWQGIYASTMTPANVNIDASGNEFEIGGTLLGTNTLSTTQLFDLEDKIQHKVDLEALGFITIKSNNAFVTTNSFIAPNTNAQIQRAIDAVSNGFTINIKAGTYAKQIAANKSVFGTNGPHQFGLFIDKNNLTIKGYKADNTAVNSASDAAVVFTTGSTANFGPSGIFVQGNDVSIEGLKIGDNLNASDVISNNKTFEAIGENFSLTKSWLNPTANQGSIYFAEWDAAHPI
ncbi:MAG: hypothetical protein MUF45_07120, partial [Spirosomaceae bacterium]|nr:hypothetical protein [Spirosomataceae bacterium]